MASCLLMSVLAPSSVAAQPVAVLTTAVLPAHSPQSNYFTGSTSVIDQVRFVLAGSLSNQRFANSSTLLFNGELLVAGGYNGGVQQPVWISSAELYDPVTGNWHAPGSLSGLRRFHTGTLLNNGKVLLVNGGKNASGGFISKDEIATVVPGNTFTGTLALPSGWIRTNPVPVQFIATASGATPVAGALSHDGKNWTAWITTTTGVTTTISKWISGDSAYKPVILRLRDANGQVVTVVTGTLSLDATPPQAAVNSLDPYQTSSTFPVYWNGSDATSGIESFDVQSRDGAGAWKNWLTSTTLISATFTGLDNHTYRFRARYGDNAGNTSLYTSGDAQTTLDLTPPIVHNLTINGGALSTTSTDISLALSASDQTSGVALMAFRNEDAAWSDWQSYATTINDWILPTGDGAKTVYLRAQDLVGNISLPVSATIDLDTTIGPDYGLSINNGALFTNQITVTLFIGARSKTAQMMLSNDGGFAGAQWQPYDTRKAWSITQSGSNFIPRTVYIKYKDLQGNVAGPFNDNIILDTTPPTGSVSIQGSAHSHSPASEIVTLLLSAADDVSGVGDMQISSRSDFQGAAWEPFVSSRQWDLSGGRTVFARFRDNAGNVSVVYHAAASGRIFLPLVTKYN
jgi:hypothetical protein